jgi:hypothetical protein
LSTTTAITAAGAITTTKLQKNIQSFDVGRWLWVEEISA